MSGRVRARSDYATVVSPCCGAVLHRPAIGGLFGKFFCHDCGAAYIVKFVPGTHPKVTEVQGETE